jgi:two-component system sensor histidine kinase PilS (NtrC family)|tara:strand:- start:21819 stop:23453 length:1635 start_codon:yes stop_codon:yes gene_type:complete
MIKTIAVRTMQTKTSNRQPLKKEINLHKTNWISVRLLNAYRLGLASLFFSQSFIDQSPLLKIVNLALYSWVSLTFVILSLIWILASEIENRIFEKQVSLQIYSDTVLIILIMHACGGISSGLGMLLIIPMAFTSLLGKQSLSLIFCSLASIGLLAEYIYSLIYIIGHSDSSTQVGILGATLFATTIATHKLTLKLRSSEQLLAQKEHDVLLLSALNQEIIENLQAGVIVLTKDSSVRHINSTARKMLDMTSKLTVSLENNHPEILTALAQWQTSIKPDDPFLTFQTGLNNLQVSFRLLKNKGQENTLVFLNDFSSIKASMHQAKLASLGHLTASIAHEIRNPLGAISHAAELLSESEELPTAERRMTEIIHQHTNRINHIIEDIMEISRGAPTIMEAIDLKQWMREFLEAFCLNGKSNIDCFNVDMLIPNSIISFDTGHLNQIMTNLCNNARTHGDAKKPTHIKVYQDQHQALLIEVADEGPGMEQSRLDKIFEPFYTTSHQGSGLGLCIVDQLCSLNNATIVARQNPYGGTSFCVWPSLDIPP